MNHKPILQRRSLFMSLLLCFIGIIVLFTLFNGLSYAFFQSKLEDEAVASNQLQLQNVMERYDNQLSHLETLLHHVYKNKDVLLFNRQLLLQEEKEANYLTVRSIVKTLREETSNPLLHIKSLIIHFEKNAFAIDQEGSSPAVDMFERAYASEAYPYAFWQQHMNHLSSFSMLPAADFTSSMELPEGSKLLPLAFKLPGDGYQIIAFIDVKGMEESFFGDSEGGSLSIHDSSKQLLYQSDDQSPDMAENAEKLLADTESHRFENGYYYFQAADSRGLIYTQKVNYEHISDKLQHWQQTSSLLFILVAGIAVTAAVILSRRLEKPVKQLVASVQSRDPETLHSAIHEFAFISQSIQELLKEREEVESKIKRQRSLLTSYGYMSQLKNINEDIGEWENLFSGKASYTILLFELRFRNEQLGKLNVRPEAAALAIREHIRHIAQQNCSDSHTFQVEKHHILCVLKGEDAASLDTLLAAQKAMLDQNLAYCVTTIAVSASFEHAAQFSHAYEQVQKLCSQAPISDDTIIVTQARTLPELIPFSAAQEQEFVVALQAGNASSACGLIDNLLEHMQVNGAAMSQYKEQADRLWGMITNQLQLQRIDASEAWSLKPHRYRLAGCWTLNEYKECLHQLVLNASSLLQEKREEEHADPVIGRVLELISLQYAEELSLDYLADKLNMSSSYLSVYIKDRTGINFIDHLNGARVERAKMLLLETTLNINDISRQIGYHNISSFNRMFKKNTGLTPGEFRKQQQQRAG